MNVTRNNNASTNGRAFGQDLSNRHGKAPGNDGGNHKASVFERRVTRSMSRAATTTVAAAATAAAANQGNHGTGNSNVNGNVDPAAPTDSPSLPAARAGINAKKSNTRGLKSNRRSFEYQFAGKLDDMDEREKDDPLAVTSYVEGMYEQHRQRELVTSVKPTYMIQQPNINDRMRTILVDWLVDVHHKFKQYPETLHLAIHLIDRYLSLRHVDRATLQLVGTTCLLIASKYEEIYPPPIADLVTVTDNAYSGYEILEMEERILRGLEYRVTVPTAHTFLSRYLRAGHCNKQMVSVSCMMLDATLLNYNLLRYLPSELACGSVMIARKVAGRNLWSPTLLRYTFRKESEVIPVARAILGAWSSVSSGQWLNAINKKYSTKRWMEVSTSVELPKSSEIVSLAKRKSFGR